MPISGVIAFSVLERLYRSELGLDTVQNPLNRVTMLLDSGFFGLEGRKARSLPPCNPKTDDPSPNAICQGVPGHLRSRLASSLLRPYSVALLLLSLGVFLWGFGYKLSLYHVHHQSTARASVVRMWVDSKSARTLQVPARNYAFAAVDLDCSRRPDPFILVEVGRTAISAAPRSLSPTLNSLLPSRAPPIRLLHGPVQGQRNS